MDKKCRSCGETKDTSEFYRDKGKPGGIESACKGCRKVIRRDYYNRHRGEAIRLLRARKDHISRNATPSWARRDLIESYYLIARGMTEQTGIPHVVDHVVPIKGISVCGLHTHTNLRVIPASINGTKGNSFEIEV